ncbi:hypothetical protein [Mesorhizobium sp. ANAO-SY3R2]|uniref:hypothetical protein n=1 Tax=Mesorhizobium sp. ANAO-SY3R2 TaxID=3166644 RepID=UPI00367309FB
MISEFADLEKLVSEAVDDVMGEPTRIVRKVKGEFLSRSADGSRAPLDVDGVVDFNPVLAKPMDMGQYDGYQPTTAADRIHVSYSEQVFADGKSAWPKDQDEIHLLAPERAGQALRVTRVDPDGLGRLVCVCVPA